MRVCTRRVFLCVPAGRAAHAQAKPTVEQLTDEINVVKKDLGNQVAQVKSEVGQMRQEMRQEMAELRKEMREVMACIGQLISKSE
eukprot:SAG22_NODE_11503_length_481_cov_1.060209_1_plen_85_part_00